jgi:hypothetical protein
MIADENTQRSVGSIPSDQIGKVFIVVGQDVHQCLICEGVFTRRAAFEHSMSPCVPRISTNTTRK